MIGLHMNFNLNIILAQLAYSFLILENQTLIVTVTKASMLMQPVVPTGTVCVTNLVDL
jgi:hypothetical protein